MNSLLSLPRSPRRFLAAAGLSAALLVAATAPAADAAPPKTGNWAGDNIHQLDKLTGGEVVTFKSKIVITAYEGRIQSVVATVRMECPASVSIQDVRVIQSWRTGRGPRISRSGGYSFRADGAYFKGSLSKRSAVGTASASSGECSGEGSYTARRVRTDW